jgi:hypothetical protein
MSESTGYSRATTVTTCLPLLAVPGGRDGRQAHTGEQVGLLLGGRDGTACARGGGTAGTREDGSADALKVRGGNCRSRLHH